MTVVIAIGIIILNVDQVNSDVVLVGSDNVFDESIPISLDVARSAIGSFEHNPMATAAFKRQRYFSLLVSCCMLVAPGSCLIKASTKAGALVVTKMYSQLTTSFMRSTSKLCSRTQIPMRKAQTKPYY